MIQETLPVRVLIIDDDQDDFFITSEFIKKIKGPVWEIDWCFNYEEALKQICSGHYNIFFVDYRMGAKNGVDLVKDAINNKCEDPIVLLTGNGSRSIDIEAMQLGAADYLIKSELTTEKLERCIRYSLDRAAYLKALRANERKFRNMFERSMDPVFLADENLVFKDVNDAATNLFEYEKAELLGMSLYYLLTNENHKQDITNMLSASGEIHDKEMELFTKQQEKKFCILSVSKETDTSGKIYTQGIIHDITNLKKAEKAALQSEKLSAAGRLVRTLAHEVRNPLNNINLSIEQLKQEINVQDVGIYFEIVSRNSRRITDIISELLDNSGPTEIVLKKDNLQNILDESIGAATDRTTLKRTKLQMKYPEDVAYIMADRNKLKIAFLNIIINAVEATEEEKGEITIALETKQKKHIVTITDNGCGISEENLSRLFEPYFTSKKNGLGLGLAATLNILQSHKAITDVQSKPGHGTCFSLEFERV